MVSVFFFGLELHFWAALMKELLGIGVITLWMQAVKRFLHLRMEGFWLIVGALFAHDI
jgi:hypothetical protein